MPIALPFPSPPTYVHEMTSGPSSNLLRPTPHPGHHYHHNPGTDARRPGVGSRVTVWRLVNTLCIVLVGTAKAVLALQGKGVALTSVDWTIGVIWAVVYVPTVELLKFSCRPIHRRSYWFSIIESESPGTLPWLFEESVSVTFALGAVSALPALLILVFCTWLSKLRRNLKACHRILTSHYHSISHL